ncbi:hypothetical protein HZH68_010705 [Vespula germanica]|uniref:Uncharacterized protein n=1 Tax=Vespula germanica TaxID=30212 RepID=A0A834JYE1_VESGE|nr:hypothetical protein HZH68_010705 [Vespula germanica]
MSEKGLGMAVMREVVGVGEVEEEEKEEEERPTSAVADDTPIPARPLLSLNDVSSKPVLTKFEIKPMDLDLYVWDRCSVTSRRGSVYTSNAITTLPKIKVKDHKGIGERFRS